MSQPLPGRVRVVIVGGGVIGCSIAYHLAHLGWTDVLVLERDRLTSGTTWHAAGLMTSFGSTSETSTGIVHDVPALARKRLLQILFAGPNSTRAVISEASRRYEIDIDIISGRIDEIAGEPFGLMAVAAYGSGTKLDEALAWFEELGLTVSPLAEAR